jgi:retinol dehydrogenase-12
MRASDIIFAPRLSHSSKYGSAELHFPSTFVHSPQIPRTISLKDQTILITGSNTAIGLEVARQYVKLRANFLILAVRNTSKGEAAKADIKSNPMAITQAEVWNLDQGPFESVIAFRKHVQELPRLDVAILNAALFKFG